MNIIEDLDLEYLQREGNLGMNDSKVGDWALRVYTESTGRKPIGEF
jgi:hypothetical protein